MLLRGVVALLGVGSTAALLLVNPQYIAATPETRAFPSFTALLCFTAEAWRFRFVKECLLAPIPVGLF